MEAKLSAGIAGIGMYVPERVLTNDDLTKMVDTSDEWITTRTGIKERRIADSGQAASDLGAIAAERALRDAGIAPEEVELIIAATATPDMQFPSTACIIQDRLGIRNIPAFDVTAGCSGFIYTLAIANQFIASGMYRTILVIGTEVLSKITNWEDRETCVLLGDGSGAVVLRPAAANFGILSTSIGADGAGGKHLALPAGGSRIPISHDAIDKRLHKLQMNGKEVFKFATKTMCEVTEQVLAAANVTKEDVALIVPHQANYRIVETAAKRLQLPMEKFMTNIDKYGNTSSASIPIALHEARATGRIRNGDYIVLTGFGAGLTWGSILMRWGG